MEPNALEPERRMSGYLGDLSPEQDKALQEVSRTPFVPTAQDTKNCKVPPHILLCDIVTSAFEPTTTLRASNGLRRRRRLCGCCRCHRHRCRAALSSVLTRRGGALAPATKCPRGKMSGYSTYARKLGYSVVSLSLHLVVFHFVEET